MANHPYKEGPRPLLHHTTEGTETKKTISCHQRITASVKEDTRTETNGNKQKQWHARSPQRILPERADSVETYACSVALGSGRGDTPITPAHRRVLRIAAAHPTLTLINRTAVARTPRCAH